MAPKESLSDFDHLKKLIDEIKICMFTTIEADGSLRSRPLHTAGLDIDGTLWFFTLQSSPKIAEAEADAARVNVSYADSGEYDYVSVSGHATLVRDREKMRQLHTTWIDEFFPKGLDDPDLVLLRVTIEKAEYWDSPGSAVGRRYALAKAVATGKSEALGENKKRNR